MRTFYILAWLISATHKLESTVFLFALFFFLCELAILKILGTGKGFLPHTEYIAYNDFFEAFCAFRIRCFFTSIHIW